MIVLIKGMEMPKKPDEMIELVVFGDGRTIKTGESWRNPADGKCYYSPSDDMNVYKVIEVPEPHGRLIDADKLKSYWEPDHSRYFDADYFIHTIDAAQTIIPASEDEIDEAQRDYQAAADYQQYCETYEQTYDPETGAM